MEKEKNGVNQKSRQRIIIDITYGSGFQKTYRSLSILCSPSSISINEV